MNLVACFLILFLFVNVIVEASLDHAMIAEDKTNDEAVVEDKAYYQRPRGPQINCRFACARRCSKTRRPNLCKRACGSCCFRCNCVPPGTYGNRDLCPCYARLTTRGGRLKCP